MRPIATRAGRKSPLVNRAMVDRKSQKSDGKELASSSTSELGNGRPEVIVEFLFDQGLFSISVNNIGTRPAISVSVEFDQKILGLGGSKDISALRLFKKIEFLGPKREIVTFVDSSRSYFAGKQPTRISARVSYSDPEKNKYESVIQHDLEIYRELAYLPSNCREND